MPYIIQEQRDQLDPAINQLQQQIAFLKLDDETVNIEECLNYAITSLLHKIYGKSDNTSYQNINDVVGLLAAIKLEYYRTVAAPYEDQKQFDNGAINAKSVEEDLADYAKGVWNAADTSK